MLYPQSNLFRQCIDLSGIWDFQVDPNKQGHAARWTEGFTGGVPIAVPASWNEQFATWRDYLGDAWYQTRFTLPWGWQAQRTFIRFNSVNYLAEVWLNGTRLGGHEGGHLPFEFEITPHVRAEGNVLVVRVDGELATDRVPPGNLPIDPKAQHFASMRPYPATFADFFPFCGIQRPVLLYARPHAAITDLTVVSEIHGRDARVRVRLESVGEVAKARFRLTGHGADIAIDGAASGETVLEVPAAALWAPGAPNLYELKVELLDKDAPCDAYTLPVGIRTIAVEGDRLLLNGQPLLLNGFSRHEDFPVTGRGLVPAVIVKDYSLMQWVGANSFRTAHYPYSEQMMDLADRLGVLVIDETPAASLFFWGDKGDIPRRSELCRQYTQELIDRDKNHPSVIMWSLANEPHTQCPEAPPFFKSLCDLARALDATRPITLVGMFGATEEAYAYCDVVCLNRYNGWYSQCGQLEQGCALLSAELDAVHAAYPKPMLLTEFGADTVAGHHAQPPEMFSEEYQAEMLTQYIALLNSKSYVVGHHVWNMCDFKTSQNPLRVQAMNLKGVFTRDRRPKLAAHRLRELWHHASKGTP
jgi:beta-glucuronidase